MNNEKDNKILFYEIQTETSSLLSNLLYKHSLQKELLINKHKLVAKYIKSHKNKPLKINLEDIKRVINEGVEDSPYNIYIANKELVIKNTTYEKDMGLDLNFAKSTFDKHFNQNVIGVSTPMYEYSIKKFFSYSDSYLSYDGDSKSYILQLSYTYDNDKRLHDIQKLVNSYKNIQDVKSYIVLNSGLITELAFIDFPLYKQNIEDILTINNAGNKINDKLNNDKLIIEKFIKNNITYSVIYASVKNIISDNTKIIYSVVLDNSDLENKLKNLNIFMFFMVMLGVIAILISTRIRGKEIKLKEQDKFVQSSMHEIKTPLSIITLNNELRELEFGKDEYSSEIDNAIKVLKTSYDDMSFTITKDALDYYPEIFSLADVLNERVDYFKSLAISNKKFIILKITGDCEIKISLVELIRLIDNNLSNAIKYSTSDTTINVVLNNNVLSFHNYGEPIKDIKHIFDKYFRENQVVGGHGLGLSIIQDITKKYEIGINLTSSQNDGTNFEYIFKCHTNDIL